MMREKAEPTLRQTGGPDSWERLCQQADTDAVGAGWGVRPMWSATHIDDTPPIQQENDQQ